MAKPSTEVEIERAAQILAESALSDIDYASVWEMFDDMTEEDAGQIYRLAREAKVVIEQ